MGRLAEVQAFIAASRRLRSPHALGQLVSDISQAMGFDHYALVHHVDLSGYRATLDHMCRGELVAISNYPEAWVETYLARNIVAQDPVLLASHRTNVGFRWEDLPNLIELTPAHRAITADTRRAGIGDGYTVPAHVPGEATASCSFAMRVGRDLPEQNLEMAQLVGAFAFQAARTMVVRARGGREPPRRLTDRQLECTVLVGRGLTEREVSDRLGISDETVKRHLKEARQTYEVGKSIQLIAHVLHDGHITLADILKS